MQFNGVSILEHDITDLEDKPWLKPGGLFIMNECLLSHSRDTQVLISATISTLGLSLTISCAYVNTFHRFDEATWTEYCVKQNAMRREVAALKTQKAIQAMQAGTYSNQSLLQGI